KEENRCFIIENYTFPSVPYTFYLDTEYDPSENWPFCVGIMVCHGRKKERVQAFFNSQKQFRQWLSMFKDTLGQYSPNAAYSWAGQDQRLLGLKENCIDLYRIVDRCLLIPLKTYELSKLATHLGYKLPRLAIRGGFDCLNAYREYRSTADSGSKILIRKQIQEYNWHDVKMLAHIHREVKRVMST
ncbi:MAG: hypothetical protein FJZ95_05685, partial [Chloroflexi bacterium]|nr:hypothetical protein [Chloroflexota bacterium]